jgi:hypothetical protein
MPSKIRLESIPLNLLIKKELKRLFKEMRNESIEKIGTLLGTSKNRLLNPSSRKKTTKNATSTKNAFYFDVFFDRQRFLLRII